jgi:Flp pilus assembly pilin Flp
MKHVTKLLRESDGQDLVEYAMLLAFVALACLLGLQHLGVAINDTYTAASTSLVNSGS